MFLEILFFYWKKVITTSLKKITRKLFRQEQYLPSNVIDRGSFRAWQEGGRPDTLARAKSRLTELLAAYERPSLPAEQERELHRVVNGLAREAGMAQLPEVEQRVNFFYQQQKVR